MFTWSFGCIDSPVLSDAIFAMISFAFIFVEVPDPVWKISTAKSLSLLPEITSSAPSIIAVAIFLSNYLLF